MNPNNEIILKITRKFESIIYKVLNTEQAEVILQEIKISKSPPEKVVEYYKRNLVGDDDKKDIENLRKGFIINQLKDSVSLKDFLDII